MAESVDAPDLDDDLSARRETGDVELLKFGEPCKMAIPSQARRREGVETRRAAPKLRFAGNGEGIVQTTNAHWAAAKVVVGKKIRWALACGGSSPPARTTNLLTGLGPISEEQARSRPLFYRVEQICR